jgi:PleD family two-component response regulator
MTVSGGVVEFKEESALILIGKADELLYKAKQNGRNRIEK